MRLKKAEIGLAGGEASRADFRLVGDDSISMESRDATEKAWEYFKKQDWEMSKFLFVKALDTGSENAPAVRGLVMSVYRGNSAGDAYDLAKDLNSVVPGVDEMVLEANFRRCGNASHGWKSRRSRAIARADSPQPMNLLWAMSSGQCFTLVNKVQSYCCQSVSLWSAVIHPELYPFLYSLGFLT